jgi:hypothetical protein
MLAKHNNVYGVLYGEEEPDEKGKKREFTTEKEYREWYAEYEAPKKEEGASLPCPLFNLVGELADPLSCRAGFDDLKFINFKFDHDAPDDQSRFEQWQMYLNCYPWDSTKKP